MADVKASPRSAPRRNRYRGLAVFWVAVVAIVFGGGVMLQIMGPPPPPRAAVIPRPSAAAISPQAQIAAPDPALQEPAPEYAGRFLPVIGKDNRAPMTVYAARYDTADKHPRVALVIDGAGLDQDQTLHVLNELPPAVDIAFSAYAPEDKLDHLAEVARKTGHECLVSIPMEPNNYPLADEGSHQLMQDHSDETNKLDLEWSLSRLTGCVGVTGASDGFMGEHFAQNGLGFSTVLEEVSKRGLLYLDPRTGAPALSSTSASDTAILTVDWFIDPPPQRDQPITADLIDQRLATLERIATDKKQAIGLQGPPQPVMLERIVVWANGLAARGVTLVPLTALLSSPRADPDSKAAEAPDAPAPAAPAEIKLDDEGPQPMTAPPAGAPPAGVSPAGAGPAGTPPTGQSSAGQLPVGR